METQTLGSEIFHLEQKYWQAMKDNDQQTILDLTSDFCIVAGANGVIQLDKKTIPEMMTANTYQLKNFRLDENFKIQIINNDTAVLAYKVHEDLFVEGRLVSLDASNASTWVRQNGKWVCALHTESIIGDPFGRDRIKRTLVDA